MMSSDKKHVLLVCTKRKIRMKIKLDFIFIVTCKIKNNMTLAYYILYYSS